MEEDDWIAAPPCWAGQQFLGSVMGTAFGCASVVMNSGWELPWTRASPGVVFGSAFGVYAVNMSASDEGLDVRLLALAFGAAAVTTWLVGTACSDIMSGGQLDIAALAVASSLSCTALFALRGHIRSLRGAGVAGGWSLASHTPHEPPATLKEV